MTCSCMIQKVIDLIKSYLYPDPGRVEKVAVLEPALALKACKKSYKLICVCEQDSKLEGDNLKSCQDNLCEIDCSSPFTKPNPASIEENDKLDGTNVQTGRKPSPEELNFSKETDSAKEKNNSVQKPNVFQVSIQNDSEYKQAKVAYLKQEVDEDSVDNFDKKCTVFSAPVNHKHIKKEYEQVCTLVLEEWFTL